MAVLPASALWPGANTVILRFGTSRAVLSLSLATYANHSASQEHSHSNEANRREVKHLFIIPFRLIGCERSEEREHTITQPGSWPGGVHRERLHL